MDYSRSAFRIGREILPAYEEARAFLKTTEATKKFSAKTRTSIQYFESLIKKAYDKFQNENK
ncbi:MAG: hypothetical protein HRF42_07830 [Candidatus Brocadia sp.]|jgi:hypothetical protein